MLPSNIRHLAVKCAKGLLLAVYTCAPAMIPAFGQTIVPQSDPQAAQLAVQALLAITSGQSIKDVTLTGQATWGSGDDPDTGTATLKAIGTGASRIDVVLSGGTRTEIRDASTGVPRGQWSNPDGTSGLFVGHNTMTDAVWFFPALGTLAGGQNVVLTYIGLENRNGEPVQHLRSYIFQPTSSASTVSTLQQLSTMDFYLDATSSLPVSICFDNHPDNNAAVNLLTEIDFANYQSFGGIKVPTDVQRYQQGALMLDVRVSGATFNTGLTVADFSIN